MKKRWLALFLAVVMLFSLSVTAMAAEVRETDFFDDQWHADVDYADMEYVPVDTEAVLAAMDETRALAEDEANIDAVREGFLKACELSTNASTMCTLAYLEWQKDATNDEKIAVYTAAEEARLSVVDGLYALARDIINSPCVAALEGILSEEDIEDLRDYENLTEEERALLKEREDLEAEYYRLDAVEYSAVVDGEEWTEESASTAYYAGDLTYDEYWTISLAVARERAYTLGELYLRVIDTNKRFAAVEGYDDAAEYFYYAMEYSFKPEEVSELHTAVKESFPPLRSLVRTVYSDLYTKTLSDQDSVDIVFGDYTGNTGLDIIDPYIASLSSELYESFTYMREHNLIDNSYSEKKSNRSFTTNIDSYHAPYMEINPGMNALDLSTIIHEFGHFNNFYWTDGKWYNGSKGIDIAEVHSQALELLFTQFYPEIFGQQVADFFTVLSLYSIIEDAIIYGAMYDELQQYAFATENVTIEMINRKYADLCREYGIIAEDDDRAELYSWVNVPHTFVSPFYYISYAVSALGACEFWLESKNDYFSAVDDYLRYTAQELDEYDFQEGFEAIGMESPFSAEFVAALADELTVILKSYSIPTPAELFADVTGEESWYPALETLYSYGYLKGVDESTFEPDGALTRSQAATVLCRLFDVTEAEGADYFPDVTEGHWYTEMVNAAYENDLINGFEDGTFRPGDSMSRQDFAVLIYNIFTTYLGSGFEGAWAFDLGAADADQIGDYAFEAVSWGVMNGYITLDENANLRPADDLTRAEMADMIYNAFFAG